jgi:DNA-binding CsgD family transcriptional regulator/tetratricopeptide (TPR) repeat protein
VPSRQQKLLERESELAAIVAGLERSRCGEGSVLWIEGPAGTGKSTLLDACAALAIDAGFRPFRARAAQVERGMPHGVVRQLFDVLVAAADEDERRVALSGPAAAAVGLFGDLLASIPPVTSDASMAMQHALYWLAANLALERPVALLIDDAQWADEASLDWLRYLSRRIDGVPIIAVLAWRSGEPDTPGAIRADLADLPATTVIAPRPLSLAAVEQMLGGIEQRGDQGDDLAVRVHAATGGNPFLVTELLATLASDSNASTANASTAADLDVGPDAVRASLASRLERLGPPALALARAVAVLDGAELRHVAGLAGLGMDDAAAAADLLAGAEILGDGRPIRFRHPLLRSAVQAEFGAGAWAAAHRDAARLLYEARQPVVRVAAHLLESDPAGDPWAAEQLALAGEQALATGAPRQAIALLERALVEPPVPAALAWVLWRLGQAERLAGAFPSAGEHLRATFEIADDVSMIAAAASELAAHLALTADGMEAARDVLEQALSRVAGEDRDLSWRLEAELVVLELAWLRRHDRARDLIARAGRLAGATTGERHALAAAGYAEALLGGAADRAADLTERALAAGRLVREQTPESALMTFAVSVLAACDRLDLLDATLADMLADAHARGSPLGVALVHGMRCNARWLRGSLAGAEEDGRLALELGAEFGFTSARPGVVGYLIRVLGERGEFDAAEELIERYAPEPAAAVGFAAILLDAVAQLRATQARWREAADYALEVGRRAVTPRMHPTLPWRATAAIALNAIGAHEEAERMAAEQQRTAADWGTPRLTAQALRAQAHVATGDRSIELFREAVAVAARAPSGLDRARCLVDLGGALRRSNRRAAAREPLREGLDLAHRCGASVLADHALTELRACGARPRRLFVTGADALTPTERRIADLAAEGRSNPEIAQALFITRKTVEKHLQQAYMKLDIRSRGELRDALGERLA